MAMGENMYQRYKTQKGKHKPDNVVVDGGLEREVVMLVLPLTILLSFYAELDVIVVFYPL